MSGTKKVHIKKAGAVIIDDKKRLLIAKPKKRDFWVFVGGKIECDETHEECLAREVMEELEVEVVGKPKYYMTSPIEPTAGHPKTRTVQIIAYMVNISGTPKPSSEIEKLHWLTKDEYRNEKFKLGSILRDHVMPKLIEEKKL